MAFAISSDQSSQKLAPEGHGFPSFDCVLHVQARSVLQSGISIQFASGKVCPATIMVVAAMLQLGRFLFVALSWRMLYDCRFTLE